MKPIYIAPSILAANWAELGNSVKAVEQAGADWIHIDVMDGHFVPPITVGASVVRDLRPLTTLPLDVHLMISPAEPQLAEFANAGADIITVHPESGPHLHRTLQTIRALGMKAGVALNPATPVEIILPVLPIVDVILIMSVNPGYGGQTFIPYTLEKVSILRKLIDDQQLSILLEIDGGITPQTAASAIKAGIDTLVAGTAIFSQPPHAYASVIADLRKG
jgi:ribulose-phosphate 3-epimerase